MLVTLRASLSHIQADMACLVTKSTYTVDEDFTGADRIVNELEADGISLADLRALLK